MSTAGLAVVTGAARGIGAAIAERLLADGHRLLLVDRVDAVHDTAGSLEGARPLVADLASVEGIEAVAAGVRDAGVPLRVLVNNAGITRDARVAKLSAQDFRIVMEVNLVVAVRLALALESAFGSGGAVVNISSRAGLGNFGQANYAASKAGLVGATRALAQRWAARGVRVNAVAPGLIETPMTEAMPEPVLAKLVDRVPLGRIGTPQDVAATVSFLASPQAAYVTGQLVFACGGRSIAP